MTITYDQRRTLKVSGVTTGKRLAPVHPGDVLLHDFIEPMGLTRYKITKLTKLTNIQQRRIDEICMGKVGGSSLWLLFLGQAKENGLPWGNPRVDDAKIAAGNVGLLNLFPCFFKP